MPVDATTLPPQGQFTTIHDLQLYYESYGDGPPLLLLHGFAGSSEVWQPFIAGFAQHFRLIIPDLRGHGRSTNPTNQLAPRQAALDILALLDQLALEQVKAIGISYGAAILLHMATQQPARIEAMVVVGAAPYFPEQARAIMRQSSADTWDWQQLRQRHLYGDDQIRTLIDHFHSLKDSYDDLNFTLPYLSTITARTLLVHGDRDAMFPVSLAVELYTAIPHASLWVVPHGEHNPIKNERVPLFTQTALDFLLGKWT